MWWKNYLIVFIVTSLIAVLSLLSCAPANGNADEDAKAQHRMQVKEGTAALKQ